MPAFDLPGVLRRIRRAADISQRELARCIDASKSAVAAAEAGRAGMDVRTFARAAGTAGMRLTVVDDNGHEVSGMGQDTVRDMSGRRFPAHLDTRHSDEGWWHGPHRYDRDQPWYTFDRRRDLRDRIRRRTGTPEDHQLPEPGDSPTDRALARRREHWQRQAAERQRRFMAGEFASLPDAFVCTCPPACDELDDRSGKPVHAEGCPCLCDVA